METRIETTADGSNTLFVPQMDEHYHSVKGARAEAEHVYLNEGYHHAMAERPRVLEIGLGTGLNAWLTAIAATEARRPTSYCAVELHPLCEEVVTELGYEALDERNAPLFRTIHRQPWNVPCAVTPYFELTKLRLDFTSDTAWWKADYYDVVFFDAFAPEKQPEMWSGDLFALVFSSMRPGGVLTTYCAKGVVRRTLQAAGFVVERLAGPEGGKREILRATKCGTA